MSGICIVWCFRPEIISFSRRLCIHRYGYMLRHEYHGNDLKLPKCFLSNLRLEIARPQGVVITRCHVTAAVDELSLSGNLLPPTTTTVLRRSALSVQHANGPVRPVFVINVLSRSSIYNINNADFS